VIYHFTWKLIPRGTFIFFFFLTCFLGPPLSKLAWCEDATYSLSSPMDIRFFFWSVSLTTMSSTQLCSALRWVRIPSLAPGEALGVFAVPLISTGVLWSSGLSNWAFDDGTIY